MKKITVRNNQKKDIEIFYEVFGQEINSAPIVLVNHALTGNSKITGENGWWKNLIGPNKTIDTNKFCVLAFNIPGNGYDGITSNLIEDYQNQTTNKIAKLFWDGINLLKIKNLFAIIGGSLGGSIAWEMAIQQPQRIEKLIPIACTNKASDWLIGNVYIQEAILNHSLNPIEGARKHAMLLYRTPESINQKFENKFNEKEQKYEVENWLDYHGKSLNNRFQLKAYKLMNHLLKTIGSETSVSDFKEFVKTTSTNIVMISIDSDYMFTEKEQRTTYKLIKNNGNKNEYHVINSIHGHDAFLIEYEQLSNFLQNHFN
ncbi:alpha/beta fold hydrolase [Flavobacterium sp. I3-2]|uniref:alpha/beta fold hydrolase n=1 Tax=Flavobacterium sp. I3-2 TaxID=2748319 RepID=UPI0021022EB2|nr:alpha/beta fold hydrolase [Flavobacterium sp. I3-2]